MYDFCLVFIDAWVGLKTWAALSVTSTSVTDLWTLVSDTQQIHKGGHVYCTKMLKVPLQSTLKETPMTNWVRTTSSAQSSNFLIHFLLLYTFFASTIYSICFIAVLSQLSYLHFSGPGLSSAWSRFSVILEPNEALCKWEVLWISMSPPKTVPLW